MTEHCMLNYVIFFTISTSMVLHVYGYMENKGMNEYQQYNTCITNLHAVFTYKLTGNDSLFCPRIIFWHLITWFRMCVLKFENVT